MADEAGVRVEPAAAIAWLRRRLALSEADWQALLRGVDAAVDAAIDAQFEAVQHDLLAAVLDAVEDGTTAEQFRDDYERIVQRHGWSYHRHAGWHSQLIFRMQTQNAYMAGRWDQVQRVLAANRGRVDYFLRYVTVGDERVRDNHAAWHGVILRADHPFWLTHWPPNGFNCRCPPPQLITRRVMERRGWAVTGDDDPRLAVMPDEGFVANVGIALATGAGVTGG
tara:strand:+ start:13331 stop:14002 length:672 start_codon:yes stop_codon:yes gene_type:complete